MLYTIKVRKEKIFMSEFVLNNNGATITLTNVSTSTTFAVENGFISPTLINPNLNETGETPAFSMIYKYI